MRKIITAILVSLMMIIALLAITNPDRKNYRMFDYTEGRLKHDYVIFSIYQQTGFTVSRDSQYHIYQRYVGIGTLFFEIKPLKIKVSNM
ncbi:MAG TPA: hypothetical protein VG738_12040 [Chitinophagaceae bacterium]|nr:hypothetical protein [Chitinophagaceae bacterium]